MRLFSAPGEGRECVEIARRILDEVRGRRALRRDRGVPALAARVPRPARERVRARRHQRLVRSRRAPAAPVGPRVPRHPQLRGRTPVGGPLRRVPLAGPGAGGRRRRSPRRSLPPADDLIAGFAGVDIAGRRPRTPLAPAARTPTTNHRRRRRPARAVEVGAADRRGVGRRRRSRALAAAAARPARGLRGADQGRAACARTRNRRGWPASSAIARTSRTSPTSRCRSSRRSRPGRRRRRGASGSSASASWRRACCAGRRACCACSASCAR